MFRVTLVILLSIFLISCVQKKPQYIKPDVKTDYDNFKKIISFDGTRIRGGDDFSALRQGFVCPGKSSYLRATHSMKSNTTGYQLYVRVCYTGDWAFYDEAYDEHGNRLETISILRKVIDCSSGGVCQYVEDIGISIDKSQLEEYSYTGVTIQMSGRRDHVIFVIPSDYIKIFLSGVLRGLSTSKNL